LHNHTSVFTEVFRKPKLVAMRPRIFCSLSMTNAGEDLVCGRERTEQQGQSMSFGLSGLSYSLISCLFLLSLFAKEIISFLLLGKWEMFKVRGK